MKKISIAMLSLAILLPFQNCGNINLNKDSTEAPAVIEPEVRTPLVLPPITTPTKPSCENCQTFTPPPEMTDTTFEFSKIVFDNPSLRPPWMIGYRFVMYPREKTTTIAFSKEKNKFYPKNLTFYGGESYVLVKYSSRPDDKFTNDYASLLVNPEMGKDCQWLLLSAYSSAVPREPNCDISKIMNENPADPNFYLNIKPIALTETAGKISVVPWDAVSAMTDHQLNITDVRPCMHKYPGTGDLSCAIILDW